MAAQSLNHGKPVSMPEVREMKRRHAAGQTVNYIANAMGRSWGTVLRYVFDLSWIETRRSGRSAEYYRNYYRERQLKSRRLMRDWRREHIRAGCRLVCIALMLTFGGPALADTLLVIQIDPTLVPTPPGIASGILEVVLNAILPPALGQATPAQPVAGIACNVPAGTLVATLPAGQTYTLTGGDTTDFAVSGNQIIVGPNGIASSHCATITFVTVTAACSQNFVLDFTQPCDAIAWVMRR